MLNPAPSLAPSPDFPLPDACRPEEAAPAAMLAAVPADWPAVMAMADRYFRSVDREALAWWLTGQRHQFQVLREAGRVTGFTHVQVRPTERTLWINLFAVSPDRLRSGRGSRMMAACARTAADLGLDRLGLCCREDNAAGQAFFRSLGFVPQGIEPGGEPGQRFIVLSRAVTPSRSRAASRLPHDPVWLRKALGLACRLWLRWR
jgi:N-acetylglutamate synthase-like GNAT family acetyltransferase